ncbi:MAG: ABC transporter permease [Deltaproteobacteria bacterium]|jgi:peptide/nickel transport system permease protein|nr:ABC transporter permease [Deltaproteobacteria bacterium]
MALFALKRLALVPFLLVMASVVAFLLDSASGGDPASISLRAKGVPITEKTLEAEKRDLGIRDDSPLLGYLSWLKRAARLDFGLSFQTGKPVLRELKERFPVSFLLAFFATLSGLVFGILLGVLAARYPDGPPDSFVKILSSAGASVPDFCLAIILLYVFGVYFNLVPTVAGNNPKNLLLPTLAVTPAPASLYAMEIRSSLLETKNKLFMKAQEARGLSPTATLVFHGLPNVMTPIVTLAAMSFRRILGGLVACELIFSINGMGKFALDSVTQRDLPVIQGYVVIMTLCVILVTLFLDILSSLLDPRVKKEAFY